jgi:hypothetical protein
MSEIQLVDSPVAEEAERLKEKPFGGLRIRLAKSLANGHVSLFPHLVHMRALSQDYTTCGAMAPISIGHSMFEDFSHSTQPLPFKSPRTQPLQGSSLNVWYATSGVASSRLNWITIGNCTICGTSRTTPTTQIDLVSVLGSQLAD